MSNDAAPQVISNLIRTLRARADQTQTGLGNETAIPQQRLSDFERGVRVPSAEQVAKILTALARRAR